MATFQNLDGAGRNRYKFLRFSQQLKRISNRAIRHIGQVHDEVPEDERATFFDESLDKWRELNITEHFQAFLQDIRGKSGSFPILVYHQNAVVDALAAHLTVPASLCLEPLLDLCVSLARDLGEDFYRHFPRLFKIWCSLLKPTLKYPVASETIQHVFDTITFCFKFLRKHIVPDIDIVFEEFQILLGPAVKPYIRQFAAESYAFLLRKVPSEQLRPHVTRIFDLYFGNESEELAEGLGLILFEQVKHVRHQFHSKSNIFYLKGWAPMLAKHAGKESSVEESVLKPFSIAVERMADHTRGSCSSMLWSLLQTDVDTCIKRLEEEPKSRLRVLRLCRSVRLLSIAVRWRRGSRIDETKGIKEKLLAIVKALCNASETGFNNFTRTVVVEGLRLARVLVGVKPAMTSSLLSVATNSSVQPDLSLAFLDAAVSRGDDTTVHEQALTYIGQLVQSGWHTKSAKSGMTKPQKCALLLAVVDRIARTAFFHTMVGIGLVRPMVCPPSVATFCVEVFAKASKTVQKLEMESLSLHLAESVSALHALLCICDADTDTWQRAQKAARSFVKWASKADVADFPDGLRTELHSALASAFCVEVEAALKSDPKSAASGRKAVAEQHLQHAVSLVKAFPSSAPILQSFTELLKLGVIPNDQNMTELMSILTSNLRRGSDTIRRLSLEVMACLPRFQWKNIDPSQDDQPTQPTCDLIDVCLAVERIKPTVETIRDRRMMLDMLTKKQYLHNVPDELADVAISFLLGQFRVNFSLIWPEAKRVLGAYAEAQPDHFWDLYIEHLRFITDGVYKLSPEDILNAAHPTVPDTTALHTDVELSVEAPDCEHILASRSEAMVATHFPPSRCDILKLHSLLCDVAASVPSLSEQRNRDLVSLFLDFKTSEYDQVYEGTAKTQCLLKDRDDIMPGIPAMLDDDEDDEDQDDEDDEKKRDGRQGKETEDASNGSVAMQVDADRSGRSLSESDADEDDQYVNGNESSTAAVSLSRSSGGDAAQAMSKDQRRLAIRLFSARKRKATSIIKDYLRLFGVFSNGKMLYKHQDMWNTFLEFLTYSKEDLQEMAFKCLLTFKYKWLTPYSDSLNTIIVEHRSALRDALLKFHLGEQGTIQESHRQDLIPLLHRILLGKMMRRKGRTDKYNPKAQRGLLLRFIADCSQDELGQFILLLTAPFRGLASDDAIEQLPGADPEKVVPLPKQLGFFNLIDSMVKFLGNSLKAHLQMLLSVTFTLAYQNQSLLQQREAIADRHLGVLKSLRSTAIKTTLLMYRTFIDFDFEPYKHAMYNAVIRSQLPTLYHESVTAPHPLLSLIHFLASSNQHCHILNDPDPSVLPTVFSILAHPRVQSSVVSAILNISDQLLPPATPEQLAETMRTSSGRKALAARQVDEDAPAPKRPKRERDEEEDLAERQKQLLPHLGCLLSSLTTMMLQRKQRLRERGSNYVHFDPVELSVLSRLAVHTERQDDATAVADLLMPYLRLPVKKVSDISKAYILHTCAIVFSKFKGGHKHFDILCSLLSTAKPSVNRRLVAAAFDSLAAEDSRFSLVASLLLDINAIAVNRLEEEPDFERCNPAIGRIGDELRAELEDVQLIPIVHQLMFNLASKEVSIRGNASHALQQIILELERRLGSNDDVLVSGARRVLQDAVIPLVKRFLRHRDEETRHETITILGSAVEHVPSCPDFAVMKPLLCKEDEEKDFFKNMRHIQRHRRVRALRRLADSVLNKELTDADVLTAYLQPLASHFIFENTEAQDSNLVTAAIEAIGAMSSAYDWSKYSSSLQHFISLVPKKARLQKTLIRLVVAMLDHFHFKAVPPPDMVDSDDESDSEAADDQPEIGDLTTTKQASGPGAFSDKAFAKGPESGEDDFEDQPAEGSAEIAAEDDALSEGHIVYKSMLKFFLPRLLKFLTTKDVEDQEELRSPVAIAMVKLLLQLPESVLHRHLPQILIKLTAVLRNRLESVRDNARSALVECTKFLGPSYLHIVISELKSGLTRGFQLHVLAYTSHAVLTAVEPQCTPGCLDACVVDLMDTFIDDIFGVVGEEKEVERISGKLKEARRTTSYDCLRIMSRFVSEKAFPTIFGPLKAAMTTTESSKVVNKLQMMFQSVGNGFMESEGINIKDMLQLSYSLVGEYLAMSKKGAIKAKDKSRRPDSIFVLAPSVSRKQTPEMCFNTNAHLLVSLGLQLLLGLFRRGRIDRQSSDIMGMLDPFVVLLVDGLFSRHNSIISLSAKVLAFVIALHESLPCLKDEIITKLNIRLIKLVQRGGTSTSGIELIQSCSKALAVSIRECSHIEMPDSAVKVILSLIRAEMEEPQKQSTMFSLLRSVIGRKFLVSDIYDVMDDVTRILVQSHSDQARQLARQTFLAFLLDYPLGQKRLQKYVTFLAANTSYEYPEGRQSVMATISDCVTKFPEKVLLGQARLLFMPLVTQLVNAEAGPTRAATAEVLKQLIGRLNDGLIEELAAVSMSWCEVGSKPALRRAGLHSIALFVEVLGVKFEQHFVGVVDTVRTIIETTRDRALVLDSDGDTKKDENWEILYLALSLLEKLMQHQPALLATSFKLDAATRAAAAKSSASSAGSSADVASDEDHDEDEVDVDRRDRRAMAFEKDLSRTKALRGRLWRSIHLHLGYPHIWVRQAALRLFGLYFASCEPTDVARDIHNNKAAEYLTQPDAAFLLARFTVRLVESKFLDKKIETQLLKNLFFLGRVLLHVYALNEQESSNIPDAASGKGEADEVNGDDGHQRRSGLIWLVRELAHTARQETIQYSHQARRRPVVFKWFAAMANFAQASGQTQLLKEKLLSIMLVPVYRTQEQESTPDDVLDVMNQLQALLKKIVGTTEYYNVLSTVQVQVASQRLDRKRKVAEEAVADPIKGAARKIRKNELKKANRRRRIHKLKNKAVHVQKFKFK